MPITDSYAQEVMIGAIGEGVLTPPTELWLALHTANPGRGGSFAAEVTGSGYARMEVTNLISSVQGNGSVALIGTVEFPGQASVWGDITFVSLCKDETSTAPGTMMFYAENANPRYIDENEPPVKFYPASVTFGLR